MKRRTRAFTLLLTACLAISMLSIGAFAEDLEDGALLNMETDTADYTVTEITDETIDASDDVIEWAEEAPVFEGKPGTDEPDTLIVIQNEKTVELTVGGDASLKIDNVNYAAGQKTEDEAIATAEVTGVDGTGYRLVSDNPTIESLTKGVGNVCQLNYYYRVDGVFYRLYAVKINQTDYKLYYKTESNEEVIAEKFDGHSGPCKVNLYTKIEQYTEPAYTTIGFHGETPGITYLTVGDTHYTIVVKPTLSYVLDFGLAVQVPQEALILPKDATVALEAGNAALANGLITYTPAAVMTGVETVTLQVTYKDGNENVISSESAEQVGSRTVTFVPATTVYYEEGFATYSEGWTSTGSKGSGIQATQKGGESTDEYGYDAYYAGTSGASNKTEASSVTKGATATFEFTGTGIEIYANTTPTTAYMYVQIFKDGTAEKRYLVDTHMGDGTVDFTKGQAVEAYNVPVVTVRDLQYGSYSVVIRNMGDLKDPSVNKNNVLKLDGFRVFGTMNEPKLHTEGGIYYQDREDTPKYLELRDYTLKALNVGGIDNIGDQLNNEQIYDALQYETDGDGNPTTPDQLEAAYIVNYSVSEDGLESEEILNNEDGSNNAIATDILKNGPKNEVYLQPNQALVFTVFTTRDVQLGMKALSGTTAVKINEEDAITVGTTDMFYKIEKTAYDINAKVRQNVTILNSGNGILSITLLKVCDEPEVRLGNLKDTDFTQALIDLGLIEAPAAEEEPAEEAPAEETPTEETPAVEEAPVEETPVEETPAVEETPVEETPAEETPVEETAAAEETPVAEETPTAEETPAEEEKPEAAENPFEDIREGTYYYNPVLWAVEHAITTGKTANRFAPADSCTRAQAVTFLYRAAGEPEPTITTCDFVDVSTNAYYYKAVLWAVENGITSGVDATHFDPNATCTRAQIVTFQYRAAGQPAVEETDAAFTDVSENAYYRTAVLWAAENGITTGVSADRFAPAETCTRGQIVTFLYRAHN